MNELEILKQRVADLEYKLSLFNKVDGFMFEKSYTKIKSPKVAFFGADPILQPSSSGTTSDMATIGGVTVTESNTFGGGLGGNRYTIGDIVKHLKLLGLLQ
jgi:hypothetical protein